jgi:GDP-D-mannose dehydratase
MKVGIACAIGVYFDSSKKLFSYLEHDTSSSEIYGLQNGAMDENSYMNPITPYGIAKMMSQKNVEIRYCRKS